MDPTILTTFLLMKELYDISIKLCEEIYQMSKHLQNTQDFINWQDKLNKISIRWEKKQ